MVQTLAKVRKEGMDLGRHLLMDNITLKALRADNFDAALTDAASWPTKLLAQMLNIPEVEVSSAGVLQPFFSRVAIIYFSYLCINSTFYLAKNIRQT